VSNVALIIDQAELEALIDRRVEAKLKEQIAYDATKPVLNVREVAALLDKHPKTIRKLVKERGLPVMNTTGREPRFMRAQVLAWLEGEKG
jgi:excisionase family DNA binding protein